MNVLAEACYRVFGSAAFRGNPVTLFEVDGLDDGPALLHAAQGARTEDNVFYTAPRAGHVTARFFSSKAELWLCGHGLLALSCHLHGTGVRDVRSTHGSWQIDVDADEPRVLMPAQRVAEITAPGHRMDKALRSIGIEPERLYEAPNGVWVVLMRHMEELLHIDAGTVASLPTGDSTPGAVIAALRLQESRYGFRYFAPWHGKGEDSGTGSAHCYLAPLLATPRQPATALQFSPDGVAEMHVWLRGDAVAVSGRVEPDR